MIRSLLLYTSRLAMLLLLLTVAVYCVLCFVPFTNQNLIQSDLLGWLPDFISAVPLLFAVASLIWLVTLHPRFRASRSVGVITVSLLTTFGVWLWVRRPLQSLGMNESTLTIGQLFLLVILLTGLLDAVDASRVIRWRESRRGEPLRLTITMVAAAVSITALFLAIGFHRASSGTLDSGGSGVIVLHAIWTQLLVAGFVLVVLLALWTFAAGFPNPALVELILMSVAACWALAYLIETVVFVPLAFEGLDAKRYAWLMAGAVAIAIAGLALRQRAQGDAPEASSGADLILGGIGLPDGGSRWIYVGGLAAVLSGTVAAELALASFDWDFLLQKLVAIAAWLLVGGSLYRIVGPLSTRRDATIAGLVTGLLALAGFATLPIQTAAVSSQEVSQQAVDSWRGFDAAFRVAHDATTPKPLRLVEDVYAFLRANTNISRARRTDPVDVNLVETLTPSGGHRPDIFIVVIDSLRRDYAAPFNTDVEFTPNIAAIAREGTAFRNAFTHYGATGLSEPSIWVGGMMLHKQYVEPFYPMNALQKLLDVEGYRVLLSHDPILAAITKDGPNVARLPNAGLNQDLCRQLDDLRVRIGTLPRDDETPLFAYLQPLNVHISSVNREGPNVPPGETYPGFNDSYAWRIRRMDECLGGFVSFLRESGTWDDSIFVVTSDHGDSLGEGGRWGHAYTITPEVLRVPLVVKLPTAWQPSLQSDPDKLVFLTDLTPSLYALLGHAPVANDEMFGRPLFTASLEEQVPYLRSDYLVASSYGPVYGILSDEGRRLFIADSVNFRDSVWEIPESGSPSERRPDTGETAEAYAKIRDHVERIARFYGFEYEQK